MTFVRACIFNLYFFVLTLVMGILAMPIRVCMPSRALAYAQTWTGLTIKGLTRICGIRVVVSGREHLPQGPCLLACQHQSAFDTLVWMNLVDRPTYVMKSELTRIPLVGPMLLLTGMIPVERTGGAKALRALLAATDRARDDGRQIIIFPEGTRMPPGEIGRLHPGIAAMAAHSGLPVIPVATDSGLRWGRNAFLKRPGTIHIVLGPPLTCTSRRAMILPAIATAWEELSRENGLPLLTPSPVDNSVGKQAESLTES
ncbi:lysophospholipid acyltransferase family protein [Novacetimonas pomaceti]|uniref:1-acyl-sn-glycerol-3-phosphate acyltransferase n=1 Tax=Novacetimonas pomaceti TaxID=2021998 RepID=A0A318QVV1_9PROT|nr:lysophospholipid acyltransferase family protein [Novacetimonas pomaceti]PYD76963.1 1-acyl-sn-glycerol-3-phosphate acyltransferase [Novacetimonas pomaceti]